MAVVQGIHSKLESDRTSDTSSQSWNWTSVFGVATGSLRMGTRPQVGWSRKAFLSESCGKMKEGGTVDLAWGHIWSICRMLQKQIVRRTAAKWDDDVSTGDLKSSFVELRFRSWRFIGFFLHCIAVDSTPKANEAADAKQPTSRG